MRRLAKFAFAVAFAGSPLTLAAQPVAQPSGPIGDVSAFRGSASTLPHIISRVEQTNPGRVIEIRFDDSGGTPRFDVALFDHGQVTFLQLADENGSLTPIADSSQPTWMMHWRKADAARIAAHAPVSLAAAIQTAEGANDALPAVAAGVAIASTSPSTDVHAYNVLLLRRDGTTMRVAVDSDTGQIIANPSALEAWP